MPDSEMTGSMFVFSSTAPAARRVSPSEEIIARIADGDAGAFDEFYEMYAPMVHAIILARVRRDDVDDLVQDVFISAYRGIGRLRDRAAAGGWLASIARNRAAEFYRNDRSTEELSEDLPAGTNCRHEAREILDTIRGLPDAYRETLVMRLVEGMTGPEISERTGLTPDSVRVNLHRGMKMLRARLGIEE